MSAVERGSNSNAVAAAAALYSLGGFSQSFDAEPNEKLKTEMAKGLKG